MIINHNIAALNTFNALTSNTTAMNSALAKLSSGKRINSAADDAAGLAISQKMTGQVNGLDQASSNAQDGISLIQTAEGALNETQSILQRMRELSVQAANDTNTSQDRSAIQTEINQLTQEIDRIASTTQFNTKTLLNGSSGLSVSDGTIVGSANASANTKQGSYAVNATTATLATQATTATQTGATASATVGAAGTLTVNGVTITVAASDTYQAVADKINASVSGVTADFGGTGDTFRITSNDVGASQSVTVQTSAAAMFSVDWSTATTFNGENAEGLTAANFGPGASLVYNGNEVQVVGGDADGLKFTLLSKASDATITVNGSLTFQIGANQNQSMNVSINAMDSVNLGVKNIDVTSTASASNAITTIDNAIATVSAERSKLGAYQNRLQHTINNLTTSSQNLQSADSRIEDVDMAKEMSDYTKNSILVQAATAMLAQANQQPQTVLSLLK